MACLLKGLMHRLFSIFLCLLMCGCLWDFHAARFPAAPQDGVQESTIAGAGRENRDHQTLMATGAGGLERVCSPAVRRMMPKLLPACLAPSLERNAAIAMGPGFLAQDLLPRPPSTAVNLPLLI